MTANSKWLKVVCLEVISPVALGALASGLIFSVLYFFYGLPGAAVRYGWVLVATMLLLFCGLEVVRRLRRIRALEGLLNTAMHSGFSPVPNLLQPDLVGYESRGATATLYRGYLEALNLMYLQHEEALIAAARARQEDLDTWVHQIKTPISAMRLLLDQEDFGPNGVEGEGHRDLSPLKMELFKIEQYVELVLYMARLEASTNDLVFAPLSLQEVVTKAVKKLRLLFIGKGIALNMQLPVKDQRVIADEKWLVVALEQVLSNAVKYTAKGTVTLGIEGPYEGDDLPQIAAPWEAGVCIVVADTGIGIAKEDLPRIFEKGYTGYHGRYDLRATGLGLFIAKRAMAQVGGTIEIESTVGLGTTVRLWLHHKSGSNLTNM